MLVMDPSDDLRLEPAPPFAERKVKLTGYRLLNVSVIGGFGVSVRRLNTVEEHLKVVMLLRGACPHLEGV